MGRLHLLSLATFLCFSCATRPSAPNDRATGYEARAKAYDAMARSLQAQNSIPYPAGPHSVSQTMNHNLKIIYEQEARRFREMARREREKASSE